MQILETTKTANLHKVIYYSTNKGGRREKNHLVLLMMWAFAPPSTTTTSSLRSGLGSGSQSKNSRSYLNLILCCFFA